MAVGKKTGGRAKGTPNRKNAEMIAAVEAGGELPLDYMLRVMRDPLVDYERRDRMAVSAAPFVHAKLQATTLSNDPDNPLPIVPVLNVTIGGTGPSSSSKAG